MKPFWLRTLLLIFDSIKLDFASLFLEIPTKNKLELIVKKYLIILKSYFIPIMAGLTYTKLFGNEFFYEQRFAIANLQSNFVYDSYLMKYIKRNGLIIDVGANIGQFRIFSEQCLNPKRVISFEPIKSTFELLEKNAVKDVLNYAVSKKKSNKFFVNSSLTASSKRRDVVEYSLMKKGNEIYKVVGEIPNTRVETCKGIELSNLDLVKDTDIELFKIDVEGAETEVLEASLGILRRVNYLLVEVECSPNMSNLHDILNILSANDISHSVTYVGRQFKDGFGNLLAFDLLLNLNIENSKKV